MRAMVLVETRRRLELRELPDPRPQAGQVLLRVRACGVCRTDLHIADGELPDSKLPLVPGHQIVGIVEEGAGRFPGDPGGRAMARMDLRRLRLLPLGPREPVRTRPV